MQIAQICSALELAVSYGFASLMPLPIALEGLEYLLLTLGCSILSPMCAFIVQVAGGALNGAPPNGVGKASKLHVVDGRRS